MLRSNAPAYKGRFVVVNIKSQTQKFKFKRKKDEEKHLLDVMVIPIWRIVGAELYALQIFISIDCPYFSSGNIANEIRVEQSYKQYYNYNKY